MLDVEGVALTPADRDLLREPAVGGVILFTRNYESPEQIADLVAEIRALAAMGCSGPNQAKAFTRCGMGPCQGRFCASTMEQLFAREQDVDPSRVGRFNARPPLKPVTLGQLAGSAGD